MRCNGKDIDVRSQKTQKTQFPQNLNRTNTEITQTR